MSDNSDERSVPVSESSEYSQPSRRRVLQAAAAVGGIAGVGPFALAQETQTIELGGQTSGWQGVAPESIADQTNPTLELEEGTTYELTWENLDGLAHNFVIVDGDGEELERTELMSEQGETQTLEFEASSEMAEYFCEPHSATMRGEISVGGSRGGQQETGDGEAQPFFQQGTEIGVQTIAEGMAAPTDFAVANEDENRYFVTDQTGQVRIVTDEGLQDEPFLDVSDRMVELGTFEGSYADQNQDYDERGLLGIDFHPEFADNGRVFVHYSAPPNDETPDGWSHVEVVSEFRASDDMSSVDPESERVLMEFQKPQYNHDGGPMAFGPEGYLYVPMGDGGGANDDMEGHVDDWYDGNAGGNGQDVSENLLGSVLRIDVDGGASGDGDDGEDGERPYGIPDDNPLVDAEEGLDEHYAWGFRNPFGISFDSDDRLFVADAGQDLYEEANIVESGGNYGWNVTEGTHCFSTDSPSQPPEDCPDTAPDEPPYDGQELQDPIVEYPHVYQEQMVGIVIVGGHVYEAEQVEGLQDKYIFGDWTSDPARQSPQGRLLAATEPEDGVGGPTAGEDVDTQTEGANPDTEGTPENATEDTQNESIDGGNETATNETADGNETATNETADGNETASDGAAGTDAGGQDQVVPRDELWEMEELQVAGSEDGSFPYFVRMFGQDDDGNVYVLANRRGVPEGETGVVMQIVPPGEGDSLAMPADGNGGAGGNETANGNETATNETADGNETTDGNATGDNESDGNATDDS
ncbi:PQQ-dependent sugar dehydrogenase [Natrinema gelatinilyticum]|uniref:PQQ-dependent sugar dehydrogenase n=1 Tax=Natrinema gelatinilyticum TaxID=2961571 RepID=UPI0020C25A8D|nr:PQQ-dependent sugar dehydrogenase [Natrinema gelatinilyticum]